MDNGTPPHGDPRRGPAASRRTWWERCTRFPALLSAPRLSQRARIARARVPPLTRSFAFYCHVLRERALRPDASLLDTLRARRRPGRRRPRRAAPRDRRLRPKPTQRRASRHGQSMYSLLRCAAPAGEVRGARATLTLRACRLMHAQARRTTKSVTINTDELSDDEEYNKVPKDTPVNGAGDARNLALGYCTPLTCCRLRRLRFCRKRPRLRLHRP